MAQYDRCSTTNGCACFLIAGATNFGLCSYQYLVECSQLTLCENSTNLCPRDYECVHHPRCRDVPICYPVRADNVELCPPILVMPDIPANARWTQNGVTVAGGHGAGSAINQLSGGWFGACGLFVDGDQTVFIADIGNHRIIQWKKSDTNGQVVAGGKNEGSGLDQLRYPSDVLIDKETDSLIICDRDNRRVVQWSRRRGTMQGEVLVDNIDCYGLAMGQQRYLYVSDYRKHEVRRYQLGDKNSTLVAGGNGQGAGLNQLSEPRYLFVDRQQNVYVSDRDNHRVMKWTKGAKEGILVAGGQGHGNALTQLSFPQGLFVDTLGTIYVAEEGNERVTRWTQGDKKQVTVVAGGNGSGAGTNQFYHPLGLSFDRHANLYVVDWANVRVQRYSLE
ncbi:unnamed protein product [Rotaria socialis]|uniref:NHL repeat protein n=1 Tax=Rotaria socialis TaxID=392032 RepID=A0A817WPA6_9BILA|nr:unnamed protein product [Rotaria socialis]CAF3358090.1 unnamed protein product [Rotaria socialis]CAF3417111.1 unnamed protein product [Rotaria socialis]CAF3570837.1 unnamed protein product [Rotaria socialis]CAF4349594.1 unnamed protein product [Rotaria socialis]